MQGIDSTQVFFHFGDQCLEIDTEKPANRLSCGAIVYSTDWKPSRWFDKNDFQPIEENLNAEKLLRDHEEAMQKEIDLFQEISGSEQEFQFQLQNYRC